MMKQCFGLMALCTSLVFAMPAFAQDEEDFGEEEVEVSAEQKAEEAAASTGLSQRDWFVSPTLSYTFADSDRGTDDGFGGTISIGRKMTYGLTMALIGSYSQMDSESGGGTAKLEGVGLGFMINLLSSYPNFYFPLNLMYGSGQDHPGTTSDYRTTIFDVGVGYLFPITRKIILRTEALYRVDAHSKEGTGIPGGKKEFYDSVLNIGLVIPLGHKEPVAEEVAEVVAPSCPPAPEGAQVDENGCAVDSDGDGVPDGLDQCPDTPTGKEVNAQGCPIDSDGDGIPDELDECPNSPAGAKVLANGCALTGDCRRPRAGEQVDENGCAANKFVLKGVKFEFDSDRLTEAAKEILVDVAATLQGYPDISVELEGHTDNVGTDAYNLGLSERRANAVKTFLAGQSVVAERMTPVGYGEAQPLASNDTEEGREENRRVELKVVE
jgi:OOP family OmpA-OmpF porin